MKRYLHICLLMIVILAVSMNAAVSAEADQHDMFTAVVILSADRPEYQAVYTAMNEALQAATGNTVRLLVYINQDYPLLHPRSGVKADLLVTIGTDAALTVAGENESTPVLSVFLPEENFHNIWKNSKASVAGIVIDQPLERFVELLAIFLDKGDRVGVFSSGAAPKHRRLNTLLSRQGLRLVVEQVHGDLSAKHISSLLEASDVILLTPDHFLITPQRSKWLLYMAYRDSMPVIAFSASYAKSGALAALFSTPEAIGRQTAEKILSIKRSSASVARALTIRGAVNYPDSFTIDVNRKVARYLGIDLPDEKHLESEVIKNTAGMSGGGVDGD